MLQIIIKLTPEGTKSDYFKDLSDDQDYLLSKYDLQVVNTFGQKVKKVILLNLKEKPAMKQNLVIL